MQAVLAMHWIAQSCSLFFETRAALARLRVLGFENRYGRIANDLKYERHHSI
jgi:hypothetical protein